MIQLSFWLYVQNNWKQGLEKIFVLPSVIVALYSEEVEVIQVPI